MVLKYKSGPRTYKIPLPEERRQLRCVRGSLFPMSAAKCNSAIKSLNVLTAREMRNIRKLGKSSVFMDDEALLNFSWEGIWDELQMYAPTLLNVISILVAETERHKPLVCFIASMALKQQHKHLSLVQRAVSLLLYGNATTKQVQEFEMRIIQ